MAMHSSFQYDRYLLKRQVLALTGKFRIYDPNGNLVLFSKQKMFRLKEDIRAYADEGMSQELLYIQARQIIDFSAAYDVHDSVENQHIGVIRRKGLRSLMRDQWEILDASENPIATLQEDSLSRALLRRFLLGMFLPQDYDIIQNGERLADLKQRFNPFRYMLDIDFSFDQERTFDHRLGIAAAILLGTVEGRQD